MANDFFLYFDDKAFHTLIYLNMESFMLTDAPLFLGGLSFL